MKHIIASMKALFALMLLGLTLLPCTAVALSPQEEQEIWKALAESDYVNEGPSSKKIVYIVGYSTCAWLQKLYQDTRAFEGQVNFRWIFYPTANSRGKNDAGYLSYTRDATLLQNIMRGRLTSPDINSNPRYVSAAIRNRDLYTGVISPLVKAPTRTGNAPSPTLIFYSDGKLYSHAGYPGDTLKAIVSAQP